MGAYNCLKISIFIEACIRISLKFVAGCHLRSSPFLICMSHKNYKHKVISSSEFMLSHLRDVRLEDITWIT